MNTQEALKDKVKVEDEKKDEDKTEGNELRVINAVAHHLREQALNNVRDVYQNLSLPVYLYTQFGVSSPKLMYQF